MRIIYVVVIAILISALLMPIGTSPSYADVGPKSSVEVSVSNPNGHMLFMTILGQDEHHGPYSSINTDADQYDEDFFYVSEENTEAYLAFVAYAANDSYHFYGGIWDVSEYPLSWGYYPPPNFKILVFDYTTKEIYASDPQTVFAFNSCYEATLNADKTMSVMELHAQSFNVLSFLLRVLATIAIEVLIALLFGYRIKKELLTITIVNIATQVLLNLAMSLLDYSMGPLVWFLALPILEIIVTIIEAIVYGITLRSETKSGGRGVLYAIVANIVSAAAGFLIAITFLVE